MAEALATPGFLRAAHADPEGVAAFDAAVARAASGGAALPPYEARLSRLCPPDGRHRHHRARHRSTRCSARAAGWSPSRACSPTSAPSTRRAPAWSRPTASPRWARSRPAWRTRSTTPRRSSCSASTCSIGSSRGPGVQHGRRRGRESARDTLRELRDSIRRIVDIARDLRLFASPPAADSGRRTDRRRQPHGGVARSASPAGRSSSAREIVRRARARCRRCSWTTAASARWWSTSWSTPRRRSRKALRGAITRITVRTRSDGQHRGDRGARHRRRAIPRGDPRAASGSRSSPPRAPTCGTGLGLSISREIVERAGGTIVAESPARVDEPARGTRFVITPARRRPTASLPPPIPSPLAGFQAPRVQVLVVEDEPALARALAEELGRHHEVTVAGGADAALAPPGTRLLRRGALRPAHAGHVRRGPLHPRPRAGPAAGRAIRLHDRGRLRRRRGALPRRPRRSPVLEKPFAADDGARGHRQGDEASPAQVG